MQNTNEVEKRIELDPWDIAELKVFQRDSGEFVSVEFATDNEFDYWITVNSIEVKSNGIEFWSFDDRCRVINFALAQGRMLQFADGKRIPETNSEQGDE